MVQSPMTPTLCDALRKRAERNARTPTGVSPGARGFSTAPQFLKSMSSSPADGGCCMPLLASGRQAAASGGPGQTLKAPGTDGGSGRQSTVTISSSL